MSVTIQPTSLEFLIQMHSNAGKSAAAVSKLPSLPYSLRKMSQQYGNAPSRVLMLKHSAHGGVYRFVGHSVITVSI